MDSVAAPRPPVAQSAASEPRPAETSVAGKGMKTMELQVEKTVAPAKTGAELRQDFTRRPSPAAATQIDSSNSEPVLPRSSQTVRNIEIDPVTRDVIFQSISRETGEVVAQVPSEQQLKIRRYARAGLLQPSVSNRVA